MNSFLTSTSKFRLYQEREGEHIEVFNLFAGDLLEASLMCKSIFNPEYKKTGIRDAKDGDVIHDMFLNKAYLLCEVGFIEIIDFTISNPNDEE